MIPRDLRRRRLVRSYELRRKALLACLQLSTKNMRVAFSILLSSLPKNTSSVRVRNRCTRTGRAGSIDRKIRISRHEFKRLVNKKSLPGIYKASW